jgi:hypothetical protein
MRKTLPTSPYFLLNVILWGLHGSDVQEPDYEAVTGRVQRTPDTAKTFSFYESNAFWAEGRKSS